MPRQFTTPILLPADPVNPLEASTKQFVDTGNTSLQRTKQPSAARWTNWRTRAVGTQVVTGTLGDDGTAFLVSPTASETATIANNRLQVNWPDSTGGALYLQQPLGATVRRIGAAFGFGPSANTTSASIALATWDTASPTPGTTNAQIHLAMTASSAMFGVVVNGTVQNLVNWPYFTPLSQDYTVYHAEVTLVGSTAFVALPDGQSQSVTDSRIASIQGQTACWEFFRDANTTTAPIAFHDTWASSMSQLGGAMSYGNVARRINTYRSEVNTLLNAKAPLASPTFTGTVTVPTTVNATDAAQKSYVDTSVSSATTGKAGTAKVDSYLTPGTYTWTKPAGAVSVHIMVLSGGGGGASGSRAASGTAALGGGGGAGGGMSEARYPASAMGTTETVVVGAGGSGGAALTSGTTGNSGGSAGASYVGQNAPRKVIAYGAYAGAASTGGAANIAISASGGSGAAPTASAAGSSGAVGYAAGGGGSGGSMSTTAATVFAGGKGGDCYQLNYNGTSGGTSGARNGTAPAAIGFPAGAPGGGGGAGGGNTTGGNGANGVTYGGGGGGGGATTTSFASGAGGTGGDGFVIITTYF